MLKKQGTIHVLSAVVLTMVGTVHAVDFRHGDLHGSFDTTLSYGQTHRLQSRAAELVGIANGGSAFSVNGDDGNLNYDTGLVSSTLKFTSDLELHYKNSGAFFRGTGFHDFASNDSSDTERIPFTDDAIELTGQDVKLLDAYLWSNFELGSMPFSLRAGEQVLSWGESTFIQNGINTINPVDVSRLRVPGSELREALLPVGIVSGSVGLTDSLNLEAYYQYDYERVLIDPPGSYFSTNDFVGNGGNFLVAAGAGLIPDYLPLGPGGTFIPATVFAPGATATRAPDDRPEEGGQYGVAMRLYSATLNDTEFGFYHIKYHSRLPIINGVVSPAGIGLAGAQYQISFPEDIKLYGFSFNTQLGTTGWVVQGEYSFREDVPLQIDDVEILAATINAGIPSQVPGAGFLAFAPGKVVPGFIRRNVSQVQMTASRVFGPMLAADQFIFVSEFAVSRIHNMPDKSILLLEGPGTNLTGNPANQALLGHPFVEDRDSYADATSWGYRMVGRLDYNNVFNSFNLQPRVEWRHDVSGNSPGPGGNFIEGNKAVTLGIGASYQNAWQADLSYTGFFGAGSQNLIHDRDFLAFSVGYSF